MLRATEAVLDSCFVASSHEQQRSSASATIWIDTEGVILELFKYQDCLSDSCICGLGITSYGNMLMFLILQSSLRLPAGVVSDFWFSAN